MATDLTLAKSIDLDFHDLKNFYPHRRASDPTSLGSSDKGLMWTNTTENVVKYWNGSAKIVIGAAPDLSGYYTKTESDARYLQSVPSTYATDIEVANAIAAIESDLAYTTTNALYTQPAANSTVSVVVHSTGWMAVGMVVYIQSAGYYTVTSITNATTAVLTNLGYPGSATAGQNINSNSKVTAAGIRGATGAAGSGGGGGGSAMSYAALVKFGAA